jgi:hypothetical protein
MWRQITTTGINGFNKLSLLIESVHSTTGVSPFEIIHGRKAMIPIDIQFHCEINETSDDYYENLQRQLDIKKAKVRKNTKSARQIQKKQYDKKLHFKPFEIGDRVRMYNPTIRKGMTKKFVRPWVGPFIIAVKVSNILYRLKDGDGRLSKAIQYNRLQICKSQKIKIKHITKLAEETQHEFNQPEDNFQYTQSFRKEISVISPIVVKLPDIIE